MMTVLLPNRLEDHLDKECTADQRHHDEQRATMNKEPANDLRHHRVQHEMLNLFDSSRQRPVAVDVAMRWGLRD